MNIDKQNLKSHLIENLKSFGWALIIALLIRSFIFEPFKVPTSSMKPTILIGDYIFVSKYKYGFSKHSFPFSILPIEGRFWEFNHPERGDIVVFRLPKDTSTFYIKRLVGLPGDEIQMVNGVLYINHQPLSKIYKGNFTDDEYYEIKIYTEHMKNKSYETLDLFENGLFDNTRIYKVPADHYFFMGDNRDGSGDSRADLGYVHQEFLLGKAEVIFFSLNCGFFEFWKWPEHIRFNRLFKSLE